ncbi:MAG: hypothetical protein V2A53_07185 [bacterium]
MEIAESIKKVIQELILPEFGRMKAENEEIKSILQLINKRIDDTNKRIDDINTHLVDQSRRIDGITGRIDRLYDVIVRREEHQVLEMRVIKAEHEICTIKEELLRLAA